MIKVLINYRDGDNSHLYVVPMTEKDYNEIKSAHKVFGGQWPEPSKEQDVAMSKVCLGFFNESGEDDQTPYEWADELDIDQSWIFRFKGCDPIEGGQPVVADHYLETGYFA